MPTADKNPYSKDTLSLWNSVCTTDPSITKRVNQRGGFTAIDAQAQLKEATKVFGPYGIDWGLRELKFDYIEDGEGGIVEVALTATFFYPHGFFEMSNDMRYRAGDECRKKLITDLRSKCLSTLGFNSDVFEGKFDDNRYVQQATKKATQKSELDDKFERASAAIQEANDADRLEQIMQGVEAIPFESEQLSVLKSLYNQAMERVIGATTTV
jgi:hypothetical protein|tara:strand:+ start:13993 stop:14628 length:636 start_codon:yes stop_codon:yes gene_type:complete